VNGNGTRRVAIEAAGEGVVAHVGLQPWERSPTG
jgi:hypothetical protein